jgi:hypothetical protein
MITFLYAGILGLLYVALAFYTIAGRFKHRVILGDGENDDMLRRIRVHGNFAEYVPLALILMAFYEMTTANITVLHIIGGALIFSRVVFSLSVLKIAKIPYGRQIGMISMFLPILFLSVMGIYLNLV